jgi:hypothetical protein
LMMEAVITSETSANVHENTWRNIPEDSHLHTRLREYLKTLHFCPVCLAVYRGCNA